MGGVTWIVPAAVVALVVLGFLLYRLARYIQELCAMKRTVPEENDLLIESGSKNEQPDIALKSTRDLMDSNTNDPQPGTSGEGQTLGKENRMSLKARNIPFDVPLEESLRQDTAHKFLDTRKGKISNISGIPFVGVDDGKRYYTKPADVVNAASSSKVVFLKKHFVKYVKAENVTEKKRAKTSARIEKYIAAEKAKVQEMRLKLSSIQELDEELNESKEYANEHLIATRHDRRDSEGAELDKDEV